MKKVAMLIAALAMLAGPAWAGRGIEFKNVCETRPDVSFCRNIGKVAYNVGPTGVRVKLGKIIGVTFIRKGDPIWDDGRVSKCYCWYYIIDDGDRSKLPYVRQVHDWIKVK